MHSLENCYYNFNDPATFTPICGHTKELFFMRMRSLCDLNFCSDCDIPFTQENILFLKYSTDPTMIKIIDNIDCTHNPYRFYKKIFVVKPVASVFQPKGFKKNLKVKKDFCCGKTIYGNKCMNEVKQFTKFCRFHKK